MVVGRETFRRHERLRGRDFQIAQRRGVRRAGRVVVLCAHRRTGTPERATRLGIVAGRRHGGAVQRNLFKRRTREVFRRGKAGWPRHWDLVVMPKTAAPFPPAYADVAGDLNCLVPWCTTGAGGPQSPGKQAPSTKRMDTP